MTGEVRLVIPAQEDFRPVAHLVAGGLAAQLGVPYDDLEDLQLALDAVLSLREDDQDVEVTLVGNGSMLRAAVGPFSPVALLPLDDDEAEFGPRRVLETVTDSFELEEREGGTWVELAKRLPAEARGS